MYRVCRPLAAATACAFWLSALAFGQPPGPPPGGGGPFSNPYGRSFQTLAIPQVQQELKLTDEQWDQIKHAQEDLRKKMRDVYRSQDVNERDPQKRQQAYRQRMHVLSDEAEDKARAILTKDQAQRLQQIIWQLQMGVGSPGIAGVLLDEDVGAKLGLTEPQRDQIRRRQADVFRENAEKMRAFHRQLLTQTREKLFAPLSDQQRKQLAALLGPEFELQSGPNRGLPGREAAGPAKPKE